MKYKSYMQCNPLSNIIDYVNFGKVTSKGKENLFKKLNR